MKIRNLLTSSAIAALVGFGAILTSTVGADARTVCNRDGDCWHESSRYDYPATVAFRFHDNGWHRHHRDHYNWRDNHDGRGYYRQGVWVSF